MNQIGRFQFASITNTTNTDKYGRAQAMGKSMKQLQLSILFICAVLVTACGGGNETGDNNNPGGNSNGSPIALGTTFQAVPGDTEITLSWRNVSGATSYNVYWNTTGNVTTADENIANVNSSYTHSSLINNTKYYYIMTAVTPEGESEPSAQIMAIPDIYKVYYVNSGVSNNDADGLSPTTAKRTIRAAIEAAAAPAIIKVNAGNYHVNSEIPTHIVLSNRVSLYGGYNNDFTIRDPAKNITTITDYSPFATGDETLPNRALEAGAGISNNTIVDGFVINGSSQTGADFTTAISVHSNGFAVIQNCTLHGGGGTLKSYGLHVNTASANIFNSQLNGGTSNEMSYGLYSYESIVSVLHANVDGGGNAGSTVNSHGIYSDGVPNNEPLVTVRKSMIDGGRGSSTRGINGRKADVRNNYITGGGNLNGENNSSTTIGIHLTGYVVIRENIVDSGEGSWRTIGIHSSGGRSEIYNNLVSSRSGSEQSIGIRVISSVKIINNTIYGGSSPTEAVGVLCQNNCNVPQISNNIIFTAGVPESKCIRTRNTNGDIDQNNLFSCATLFHDLGSNCSSNTDDINSCDLDELNGSFEVSGFWANIGNISVEPQFVDIDGEDNDIHTMSDNDWHLTSASPLNLRKGGEIGSCDCKTKLETDKDGNLRTAILNSPFPTNAGARGWSMGGYELN